MSSCQLSLHFANADFCRKPLRVSLQTLAIRMQIAGAMNLSSDRRQKVNGIAISSWECFSLHIQGERKSLLLLKHNFTVHTVVLCYVNKVDSRDESQERSADQTCGTAVGVRVLSESQTPAHRCPLIPPAGDLLLSHYISMTATQSYTIQDGVTFIQVKGYHTTR